MRSCLIALLSLVALINADEFNHRYPEGAPIDMWVNKVGPYRNPQETYKYYSLPYCAPVKEEESRWEGLGEALQGFELIKSDMQINFKKDVPTTSLCVKKLNNEELDKFTHAVKNQYWYQLFCDDLPIWGMVGDVIPEANAQENAFLYTHKKFVFTYNEDRIIEVNLTSEVPVPLTPGANIQFTYSVNWYKTEKTFKDRFEKYLDDSFFEHQIHWFSIFNSFMMVIFLTGLVSMILMRTLRKDYARYTHDEEDVDDDSDNEYGWKQIHGDVFRPPAYLALFSALVGTGHQLIILTLLVILVSSVGHFYTNRGTQVTVWMLCYLITSFIAGYGGGGYYHRNGGKMWIQTALLTAFLFPGICFSIALSLDVVAMAYQSLAAIPIGTMFVVSVLFIFISVPLTFVGTLVGRHWNGNPNNPCRINPVPRLIVEKKWYLHPIVNILLGGILPFGSIFIEMYFMFTSFWHYKYYYVYGFLLLVFLILIVVSVCVTIVSTYFLLNSEDYRWQWVSFLSSASTAGYVFLYCIYYFFAKTKMSGFFQTVFYFGYMAMFCIGLGILCGAVGFIGTSLFVRQIYHNIKIE